MYDPEVEPEVTCSENGLEEVYNSEVLTLDAWKHMDTCLVTPSTIHGMTPHTFISDGGASSHMGPSAEGMVNLVSKKSSVRFGVGDNQPVETVGGRKGQVIQKNGKSQKVTLENFKHVPGLWTNLFSLTNAMKHGWKLNGEGKTLSITKGSKTITFDRTFKTGDGFLVGVEFVPDKIPEDEVATLSLAVGSEVDINDFHAVFNHSAKETL